jgi:hypothetical protein
MKIRAFIGIVALGCVSVCGMLAAFAHHEMMDKVNVKLVGRERFDPLGWYWSKTQRLHREYGRLYPDGRLLLRIRILMALAGACSFISACCFKAFER